MNSAGTYELGVNAEAVPDRVEMAESSSVPAKPEAIHPTWESCRGDLRRLVVAMGIAADRVDDVLQDAYVAALQQPPRVAEPDQIRRWLFRVVANRCRLEYRKRSRWRRAWKKLAGWWRAEYCRPADEVAANLEQRKAIREALERLSDPGRTILVLRYFSGFNSREIAGMLDLSDNTVRSHLRRGRIQLADALQALEPSDESM